MKQIKYEILALCLIFIAAINLNAQTSCPRNFTVKAVTTPSTCAANGTITVTLEGDLSGIMENRTEYAIRPDPIGSEGTSTSFSKNNVFTGVAPATYLVSIRTYCTSGAEEVGVVTEASNVKVAGDYKPLMAVFDPGRSRKAYPTCSSGLIAFNVQNGTGNGSQKFFITKAPAGVTLGEFTPVPSSVVVSGFKPYELSGLYPSGDYQIDIVDDCSVSTVVFTLGEITGFYPNSSLYYYRPNTYGASRNQVQLYCYYPHSITYPEHYRYYIDQMYELAIVPTGQTPVASDWKIWKNYLTDFTITGEYKDHYAGGTSLTTYIRVKDCDDSKQVLYTSHLWEPYFSVPTSYWKCDDYTMSISNYVNQYGFWNYPVEIKVTNTTTSNVVYTKTFATSPISVPYNDILLEYGDTYNVLGTDAEGKSYSQNVRNTFNPFTYTNGITYYCDKFRFYIQPLYSYNYNCPPVEMTVKKKNPSTGLYEPRPEYDHTFLSTATVYFEWEYGEYQIDATYPNHLNADGTPYKQVTRVLNVQSPNPVKAVLASGSYNSYVYGGLTNQNHGFLQIGGRTSANAAAHFPIGTVFTIVDAPDGYIHKGKTFPPTNTSAAYFYITAATTIPSTGTSGTQAYMPDGNYKVRIDIGCGTPFETELTYLKTGYNAENVKFKIVEDDCLGARLMLEDPLDASSYVTLKGTASASYTNFRIVSGPNGGYETGTKKYNESLLLTADGEYTIGIVVNATSFPTYHLLDATRTIRFTKSKPTLNPTLSGAYVCADPGATDGHIMFVGQGGRSPYEYELLNEDGTPTGLPKQTANAGDRVEFTHGSAGETYLVRITDDCGNSTTQEMPIADLGDQQAIIYKIPAEAPYCTGDTIKLNCITLGETTYKWEKKKSDGTYEFFSNDQNPRVHPATTAHSGTYRITVTPEYCGLPIVDSVEVVVMPPLALGTVSADQNICAGVRAAAMSCPVSGGKGIRQYQWQVSTDGATWANVAGATGATYAPLHGRSGEYYYRLQVTDDCATLNSATITIKVRPCFIIINPNLRHKAY